MEPYRYQEFAYLIIPILLGVEFFRTADQEREAHKEYPIGSYVLFFFGFVFIVVVPVMFASVIWAVTSGGTIIDEITLARFDRYGVMFMFLGAWWQIYLISALRTRRLMLKKGLAYVMVPFFVMGLYVSVLILKYAPFSLMWVSIGSFLVIAGFLYALQVGAKGTERAFWALTAMGFLITNLIFVFMETVV